MNPVIGKRYTWQQVQKHWHGEQTFLAKRDGRIVCATLVAESNPEAPEVMIVGTKPRNKQRAKEFCDQGGVIPVFIKYATNDWEFKGFFEFDRYATDAETLKKHAFSRSRLTRVIYLRQVDGPKGNSEGASPSDPVDEIAAASNTAPRTSATAKTSARIFGHVPGSPPGITFPDRRSLAASGVHRPPQGGISGNPAEGADSIVVSGGYPDDEDGGDVIIYTGQGGNDPATKRQVADQQFVRGNAGLAKSCDAGLPVRVIRGAKGDARWSPATGFRYDGLFRVASYWHEVGRDGFTIWRYRLERIDEAGPVNPSLPSGNHEPKTKTTTVERVIRSTVVAQAVKTIHKHTCQICSQSLGMPTGPYAEGAHVRPLGKPHNGPDVPENVLCLCPNCHVRFDAGALAINDDLQVLDVLRGSVLGDLRTHASHAVGSQYLEYHRTRIAAEVKDGT